MALLTKSQREVAELILSGLTYKEIVQTKGGKEGKYKTALSRAIDKLEAIPES